MSREVVDIEDVEIIAANGLGRLAGAIARDVEESWGGVDVWYVPAELRGSPNLLRCERCLEMLIRPDSPASNLSPR